MLSALAVFGWTHNVYYTAMLGLTDFSSVKTTGPFKVGVKWIRTSEHDNEVIVFYPIDEIEYEEHIEQRNAPWLNKPELICA